MEQEATRQDGATVVENGPSAENAGSAAGEQAKSKVVPFPTDKLRELYRRPSTGSSQAPNQPSRDRDEEIDPQQRKALDMIGETVTSKVEERVGRQIQELADENDTLSFERELDRISNDPKTRYIAEDFESELRRLSADKPNAKMKDLVKEAQSNAVLKAFNSGKLMEQLASQAATDANDTVQSKVGARSGPTASAASTGRGQEDVSLDDMTAEQLAASGKLDEVFQKTFGRKSRY